MHDDDSSRSVQHQQKDGPLLHATVPRSYAGQRLDQVLSRLFQDYSRSRMQAWIRGGRVTVDGRPCLSTRQRVDGGEALSVEVLQEPTLDSQPEDRALDVVFEDRHLLVLDKPAGLVVHPGAGNAAGTLLNALLHLDPKLAQLPRAGLVHRLDKDTTGLMVVARSLEARTRLTRMIAARAVTRLYQAVVHGVPSASGSIEAPLGRHPRQRTRMAVRAQGKPALTHYRRRAAFRAHGHLELQLETGRTHQIRVHLAHIGHPIVGDRDYAGARPPPAALSAEASHALRSFPRQALHAWRLVFEHPLGSGPLAFDAPLPAYMAALIEALARDASAAAEC